LIFAASGLTDWEMISFSGFYFFRGFSKKCNFCGTRVKFSNCLLLVIGMFDLPSITQLSQKIKNRDFLATMHIYFNINHICDEVNFF